MTKKIDNGMDADILDQDFVGGETLTVSAPKLETAIFNITGTSPLVINNFSQKALNQIIKTQEEGSKKKGGKKVLEPKNFDEVYQGARHIAFDGWDGIPSTAFYKAMISACRLTGLKMTQAKQVFNVESDGFDETGYGLVRITGEPTKAIHRVRLPGGQVDIRARPMWHKWSATLRVTFDSEFCTRQDIANLVARAGAQCGVCEGRPTSKSGGMGWGLFKIEGC